MAAAADAPASTRVVAMLRQLEENAKELSDTASGLKMDSVRWTIPEGENLATLPRNCAQKAAEGLAHSRRATEASRQVEQRGREKERWRQQQAESAQAAAEATEAAETRRLELEQRFETLKEKRRAAEAAQRQNCQDAEARGARAMQKLEEDIAACRASADAHAQVMRKEVLAERERGKREIEQLRQDFKRKGSSLEKQVLDEEAKCSAAIAACAARVREAEVAAASAWHDCQAQMQLAHCAADEEVLRVQDASGHTVGGTNRELEDVERDVNEELNTFTAQEESARADTAAETHATTVCDLTETNIKRQKAECDLFCSQCRDEMLRLVREAGEAEERAVRMSCLNQEIADENVKAVESSTTVFAKDKYVQKIESFQKSFNDTVLVTRGDISARLTHFEQEARRLADEADVALVKADQQVESLRMEAYVHASESAETTLRRVQDTNDAKSKLTSSGHKQLRSVQDQLVRHIDTQKDQMLDSLSSTQTRAIALKLDLGDVFNTPSESKSMSVFVHEQEH